MNDSTSPSERDIKPGDRVRYAGNGDEGVAFGTSRGRVAVDWDAGYQTITPAENLSLIPAHPIPSEPNTAWVDKDGDVWIVKKDGSLFCSDSGGNGHLNKDSYAPFTRLVPEGSERDAAIREVAEFVGNYMTEYAADRIHRHFLSGVDQ